MARPNNGDTSQAEIVRQIIDFNLLAKQVKEICQGEQVTEGDALVEKLSLAALKMAKATQAISATIPQELACALMQQEGESYAGWRTASAPGSDRCARDRRDRDGAVDGIYRSRAVHSAGAVARDHADQGGQARLSVSRSVPAAGQLARQSTTFTPRAAES